MASKNVIVLSGAAGQHFLQIVILNCMPVLSSIYSSGYPNQQFRRLTASISNRIREAERFANLGSAATQTPQRHSRWVCNIARILLLLPW